MSFMSSGFWILLYGHNFDDELKFKITYYVIAP